MATDRSVNININYKVNSVEIEKGEASVKRADQATEQLRQATQKFANTAGTSFKSTSKYIEGMEIELAKLRQQIRLTSTEDTARLSKLSAQYKALKAQVDAYNKSLFEQAKATKESAQHTKDLASQFGQVYTAAKLLITAGVVREVINISLEMAKLSGNVEGVTKAFERQIPGAQSVLIRLREATRETVNDLELMQRALQAQNFGIDVQRLPELLEFAAIRAQQTGQSVDYLVNSIVMGIGRKSLLILDNLGISATRLKAEFNGASLAAQSVARVTEGVANIAQIEMQKMGGYVSTSATQVDQLTTSWHELRVEASKFATDGAAGGINGVLKSYVDTFKVLVESWNRGISASEVFAEKQREAIAQVTVNEFITRRFTESREENIKALEEEISALTAGIGVYAKARGATEETIAFLEKEFLARRGNQYVIRENIDLIKAGLKEKTEDALLDQLTLRLLQDRLQALKVNNEEQVAAKGIVEELREEIERLNEEIEKTRLMSDLGASGRLLLQRDKVQAELDKLLGKSKDSTKKSANEIQEYLGYLSDLELFSMNNMLEERRKAREKESEREKENNERSFEHWKYYDDLKRKKQQEASDEAIAIAEDEAARRRALEEEVFKLSEALLVQSIEMAFTKRDEDIDGIRSYYDEQILLAGDNERAKKELQLKRDKDLDAARARQKEADKRAARASILIEGLVAIAKIFAEFGWPAGIIPAGIMAGITATNVSEVGKYKDGVIDLQGPGTSKSDSIPSMLSRGESVMTAEETRASKNTLKAIRAKKLNDSVLKEIVSGRSGGSSVNNFFDDSKIVKELRDIKNSQPDIIQRGNLIYETRKKSDTYKQYVRSKSMG